jgi:four helix bundle protein
LSSNRENSALYGFDGLAASACAHITGLQFDGEIPARERFGMVSQVRRSAVSVAANIAQGFRRRTTRELLRSLQIALGEVEETRYFLILSFDLKHIAQTDFDKAAAQCDSVGRLINALATSLRKRLPVT